jgi:uroporphyrinogen-III synthase
MKILVLRPQPGADETAARARALGLEPIVAPLFAVRPLAWTAPDPAGFDAVMLTSASAARQAGGGLTPFHDLPCYAVGEATAAAAREAGFADIRIGPDDGAALLLMMAQDGVASAFHACGEDHLALGHPAISVARVPVYAAEAVTRLPVAPEGMLALLHSPRAAALLGALVPDRSAVEIAAISARTARAAGDGWKRVAVAAQARDHALLELAAKLCQREKR